MSSNVRNVLTAGALVVGLCLLGFGQLAWDATPTIERGAGRISTSAPPLPPLPVPELPTIRPLAPEQAIAINEATPISSEPIEAALPFRFQDDASAVVARATAADCMTAAIYYEAATEGERGQRAVAQVVLNRVRHPAYPNSVCGVVYQGSERTTGCQFTFTCDGSLARKPSSGGWARARRIALAALDGEVEPTVGMATHYHANYVVPYWASSLVKLVTVGNHIFYRWSGFWGKRRSFNQAYGGESLNAALAKADEPTQIEGLKMNIDSPAAAIAASRPLADLVGSQLKEPDESRASPSTTLQADQSAGVLRIDEQRTTLLADRVVEEAK